VLSVTDQQAKQLGVTAYRQISPYLENCCLRVSANVSYAQAADDVKYLTGVYVAAKTQQRLVQRHSFAIAGVEESLKEVSVDGGKVRLRTAVGEPCVWKDYKAVATDEGIVMASYQDNDTLVEWVNQQSIAVPLTALGDGHDGVWNIINQMSSAAQRREVLDWYHLVENLHKVGGSIKRLHQAEALLWRGKVDETIAVFDDLNRREARNFCNYLRKHRHRIVNYDYYQQEQICSIGSGAVESAIKQVGRRVKISGAQWNEKNVPQVLAHRCAYLNGLIGLQR
jgi:hypothetical protein